MSFEIKCWEDVERLFKYLNGKPVKDWTNDDAKLHGILCRLVQIDKFVKGQTKGRHMGTEVKEGLIEW